MNDKHTTRVTLDVAAWVNGQYIPTYFGSIEVCVKETDGEIELANLNYDRCGISDSLDAFIENHVLKNLGHLLKKGKQQNEKPTTESR